MNTALWIALGGLGLFLMGMANLTEGLRALAGGRLAQALTRFTSTPWRGALTGLLATAAMQSSSAITVIAVGFAGAGLLSFTRALGVVFGANLGSTLTGWLVATLGFKVDLDQVAPVLVFVGMSLRFLGRARWRSGGQALAGFGLLFTGLGVLQEGVAGIDLWPTPEALPPNSLWGRAALVGLGLLLTLITQASSAGVAMALAAVSAGQLQLAQAGAMVIGMDLGTTVTALLASLGGSLEARRTAWAHVIFNVLTAIGAFLLLMPYLHGLARWLPGSAAHPEYVLVGFHSGFNLLGVLLILPLTGPFARLIERLLPERNGLGGLDRGLLRAPQAAVESAAAGLRRLSAEALAYLARRSQEPDLGPNVALEQQRLTLRRFLLELETDRDSGLWHQRHVELLEALDHLERALRRAEPKVEAADYARAGAAGGRLSGDFGRARREWLALAKDLRSGQKPDLAEIEGHWQQLGQNEPELRLELLRAVAADRLDDRTALGLMDEARRLRRLNYHAAELARRIGPYASPAPAAGLHSARPGTD